MTKKRPALDILTPTRAESSAMRVVASLTLLTVVAFFVVSANHHGGQAIEFLNSDLSSADYRLLVKSKLGMIDAVWDLMIANPAASIGLFHPLDLEGALRVELWMSFGLGAINGLLALLMLGLRRFKALALFVSALWVLVLTASLVLASPSFLGSVDGPITCNCTGLKIIDADNIWMELVRNGVMTAAMLWMAYLWSTPEPKAEDV
ncbi:MAG: hypothetical protein KDB07_11020 [Planctomycetes bacterium]|nr:hypothetical protein [Planctomycetota bacterium]